MIGTAFAALQGIQYANLLKSIQAELEEAEKKNPNLNRRRFVAKRLGRYALQAAAIAYLGPVALAPAMFSIGKGLGAAATLSAYKVWSRFSVNNSMWMARQFIDSSVQATMRQRSLAYVSSSRENLRSVLGREAKMLYRRLYE